MSSFTRPLFVVLSGFLVVGCGSTEGRGRGGGGTPGGGENPPKTDGTDPGGADGGGVGGGGGCNPVPQDKTLDQDGDGHTAAMDCNDCDPLMNPGAYDVGDNQVDDDCDGASDNPPAACDSLAAGKNDPTALAQSFEQCDPRFFKGATLVGPADARARAVVSKFGVLSPKTGSNMTILSTGLAADKANASYAAVQTGTSLGGGNTYANPLPNLPGAAGCSQSQPSIVNDYTELVIKLKAPTNANSFSFQFHFLSAEYPEFVCTQFNDEFLVIMESSVTATTPTNISFDMNKNPITINNGLFTVCQNGGKPQTMSCTKPVSEIAGTGYEELISTGIFGTGSKEPMGGSTGWLTTTAPVTPGEDITLRFIIFDQGDHMYDSTVLIDNFQWSITATTAPTTIS